MDILGMGIVKMHSITEILKIGIPLKTVGVDNWALSKEDAIHVLDKFYTIQVPVLGGDVCEIVDGIIQYNDDNWYCDRQSSETYADFVSRSIHKARNYINEYNSVNLDKIFFVLVPET